jgi:hypothetical protein
MNASNCERHWAEAIIASAAFECRLIELVEWGWLQRLDDFAQHDVDELIGHAVPRPVAAPRRNEESGENRLMKSS